MEIQSIMKVKFSGEKFQVSKDFKVILFKLFLVPGTIIGSKDQKNNC